MPATGAVLNRKNEVRHRKIPLLRAGFFYSETTFKLLMLIVLSISCCFNEQRYKFFESNSQLKEIFADKTEGCFNEQRYKFFESNSQLGCSFCYENCSCFNEQRYKFFESNSQLWKEPIKNIIFKPQKNSPSLAKHSQEFTTFAPSFFASRNIKLFKQ